jgi:hypothetical protein
MHGSICTWQRKLEEWLKDLARTVSSAIDSEVSQRRYTNRKATEVADGVASGHF